MRRGLLALIFVAFCSNVQAQPGQSTTGNHSPIINQQLQGTVNINNVIEDRGASYERVIDSLNRTADKELVQISAMLARGEVDAVVEALERFLARESKSAKRIALAHYTRAQLMSGAEDDRSASELMLAAITLDPSNCYYRALRGMYFVRLGQLNDVSELFDVGAREPMAVCLSNASASDRALLHLLKVWVAAERRDEAAATQAMDVAHRSFLVAAREDSRSALLEPACLFREFALGYWPVSHARRWPNAPSFCSAALSKKKSPLPVLASLQSFYEAADGQALAIGAGIDAANPSFDGQPLGPTDRLQRRIIHGSFKSDYGMKVLWQAGEPERAAKLYAEAFEELEPLLDSGRPSLAVNFAQLVIRILHLEEISAARAFTDSEQRLRVGLTRAARAKWKNNGMSTCLAYEQLASAASRVLSPVAVEGLSIRVTVCRQRALVPGSFSALMAAYKDLGGDDSAGTLQQINARLAIREQLEGFPEVRDLQANQSFDLLMRAKREGLDASKDSAEQIEIFTVKLYGAAQVASRQIDASRARMVLASTLPYIGERPHVGEWASQLLRVRWRREDDGPSIYGRCQQQYLRLRELQAISVNSLMRRDMKLADEAIAELESELRAGNRCMAVPRERDLGSVEYSNAIEDIALDQRITMQARDPSNGNSAPYKPGKDCIELFVRVVSSWVPMCMYASALTNGRPAQDARAAVPR